jgi:polyhydroxybutyrate depolymerase
VAGIGSAATLAVAILALGACRPEAPPVQSADYGAPGMLLICDSKLMAPVRAGELLATPGGARFKVRAPPNYDPNRAHPLLLVFPPAGFSADATESHAGLTVAATRAGFVVAFAEHRPLSPAWVRIQAEIPAAVMRHWCIDPARVVLAGHFDGGTVAEAAAFLQAIDPPPLGVVASGAGTRAGDLATQSCPAPPSVLILHSRDDTHFPTPAFGESMARWWAGCNRCRPDGKPDEAGCLVFGGCEGGSVTRFCETHGPHARWNWPAARVVEFAAGISPMRR